MDLALKDLGQTLAVGMFAVFGLVYSVTLFSASWKQRVVNTLTGRHKLHQTGMILALVFATGVLIEDLSKNYTAERVDDDILFKISSAVFNFVVDTDRDLRLRSFVSVHNSANDYLEFSPAPVYESLMSFDHTDERFTRNKNALTNIPSTGCRLEREQKKCRRVEGETRINHQANLINQMYYDAKNRVYQESTYFTELQEIEKRLNFARSLTFLCLGYAIIFLGLLAASYVPSKNEFCIKLNQKQRVIFFILCVYTLGTFLAKESFRSETINYNLRVFGYYASLAQSDLNKAKDKTPKVIHGNSD